MPKDILSTFRKSNWYERVLIVGVLVFVVAFGISSMGLLWYGLNDGALFAVAALMLAGLTVGLSKLSVRSHMRSDARKYGRNIIKVDPKTGEVKTVYKP